MSEFRFFNNVYKEKLKEKSNFHDWEVHIHEDSHLQKLQQAATATILPFLNNRLMAPISCSLNSYEQELVRGISEGEKINVVSLLDLDGTVFPYPLSYHSLDEIEDGFRLGYRFIHEVACASLRTQIYTSRIAIQDKPPFFIPKKKWKQISNHFPFMSHEYMERLIRLGKYRLTDNTFYDNGQMVPSLAVMRCKYFTSPIDNIQKVLDEIDCIPEIIYYFGDASIDHHHALKIKNIGLPLKFIRMGPLSRRF